METNVLSNTIAMLLLFGLHILIQPNAISETVLLSFLVNIMRVDTSTMFVELPSPILHGAQRPHGLLKSTCVTLRKSVLFIQFDLSLSISDSETQSLSNIYDTQVLL